MPDNNKAKKYPDKMSEIDDHIQKRFDIRRRLGKGAYGIVWKAMDRKTKKVVAIKKIFDAFRNQIDSQRTFREIMFLQAFSNHPNIIKLYSIHRAGNNRDIYLGFEYMETDLHNVIKRQNLLKDIHIRYIMYQLFKAMKYIHSGNVIHRDLKPSNILLNSACHCKIADFGLARSVSSVSDSPNSDSDPRLTDYVATRWYRAPEILIANTRYTKGIDMWSLGCIFGEMLAGKPLFPGSSTVNQVEKILSTLPSPTQDDINSITCGFGSSLLKNTPSTPKRLLADVLSDAPKDAMDLITQLLIFNPNKRPTSLECLEHEYVIKFHNNENEPYLDIDIVPPLSDDIQLTVDDYRNKLYELMAERNHYKRVHSMHSITHGNSSATTTANCATKVITTAMTAPQNNLYTNQRANSGPVVNNHHHHGQHHKPHSTTNHHQTHTAPLPPTSQTMKPSHGMQHSFPEHQKPQPPPPLAAPMRMSSTNTAPKTRDYRTNATSKSYIKSCYVQKERPTYTQSEQKINNAMVKPAKYMHHVTHSESKITMEKRCSAENIHRRSTAATIGMDNGHYYSRVGSHGNIQQAVVNGGGGFGDHNDRMLVVKRTSSHTMVPKRKTPAALQHFNSYHPGHGVISASALMDLKTSIR